MHAFRPASTAQWEDNAAGLFAVAWHGLDPLTQPCRLTVRAVAKRPQRLCRKKDPAGRIWRTTKPDLDNVVKAVCDALVRARVIIDDTHISALHSCASLYAAKEQDPCVEVELSTIGGAA